MNLRKAKITDCRFFWELRNDSETRESSFNPEPISYQAHELWYENVLASPHRHLFVIEEGADKIEKIGYVRLRKENNAGVISIAISKPFRGKGYGSRAIKIASEHGIKNLGFDRIIAYVKKGNEISIKAFTRAGFVLKSGEEEIVMEYTD